MKCPLKRVKSTQRDPLAPAERLHKINGGLPFGLTCGLCNLGIHHQAMPVLHQYVPQVSQFRFRSLALFEQKRILVRPGCVRVTAALLTVKVHCRITATARRLVFILGPVTLVRSQRLYQRAVHTEMLF
jgi:hypothetical protein